MADQTTLMIQTVDGECHTFGLPVQPDGSVDYNVASRFDKLLNQRSIALAVDNRLLIIPMEQIRSIQVYPLKAKLPETVVPSVSVVSSSLLPSN